ncbi:MAG: hypothetical protein COA32_14755 [Fluviicola sp.]|nr:MAG: hypothetical protein COA32_14755 [Fluviicola sp.]
MQRDVFSIRFVTSLFINTNNSMKILVTILTLFIAQQAISQELIRKNISSEDPYNFYINDNDSTNLFYYKMVPKEQPIGVLTILPSGGESIESMLSQITLHEEALKNNFLVIFPSYNWGTIQQIPEIDFFDTIFKQVVEEHNVSKDNFIFCGLSNGAMISLTYGLRATRDSSTYLVPKGIIGLDPPLDLTRFYRYCEREIKRDASEAGVAEAKWIKSVYEQVYGGSPDSVPMRYQEASVFTYGAEKGGNAQYFNDIAIRMHSDLNVDFLINERNRDLYDWNGSDIVAFVNQLKLNGHKQAEVVITKNKGRRPDGSLHPHSWSIIETDATIEWMLKLLDNNVTDKGELYDVHDLLSKSAYLEDLEQLVDSIKTYHPQPYEFISEQDFDYSVNHTKQLITDSTTIAQFSWMCNSITAMVGCLHTSTNSGNILRYLPDMFFPVKAQFVDNKLYLMETYTDLKPGLEILKINDVDVLRIKKEIAAHISSDGYNHNFTDAIINEHFSYFCTTQLNFPTTYQIEVQENGIKKKVDLKRDSLINGNNVAPLKPENLDFSINASENLATITIRSFVYYDERLPVFKSFIDSCFRQIESKQIENVVIDLRDNGGGDPYCAAHLLQYISNEPFRYYKKSTTSAYKDLEKKIKPFENNFNGNLYVLINSLCASTTGHLSSILAHKNLGTLIGSETGATYSCNAHNIQFELENTGIRAFIATKTYQTDVVGMKKNRGILPDYEINRSLEDIIDKKDLEMEKVMELIDAE